MKKHFVLAAVAATAMLASCSNDNDEAVSQNVPVQFTISTDNIATRTTTTASGDTYSTTFNDGDMVGIYSSDLVDASGNSSVLNNAHATVSGNHLTGGTLDGLYYPKTGTARLAAYYPAGEYTGEGSISFSVQVDQSSENNFNKSDFMTSVVSTASTTNAINFSMRHRLAFVELKLNNMDEASVTLNNVSIRIGWTPQTDNVQTLSDDIKYNIKMFMQGDTKTYWALLPAQTINSGATLFTIEHNGYTYIYNVSSPLILEANKVTRISLSRTVTGDLVVTPNINGENWGSTGDGGSGTVTDKNYIAMPENGTLSPLTGFADSKLGSSLMWGYSNSTSYPLTSASYQDKTFTVVSSGDTFSWSRALMAYSSEKLSAAEYLVSFKIKSTSDNTSVSKVSVVLAGYKDTSKSYFFPEIKEGQSVGFSTPGVTTQEKTIECIFNPSTYYENNSIGSSFTKTGDSTEEQWKNGFKIAIGFGGSAATPITYTLSDLKITKK